MRKFKLQNALGQEYDLNHLQTGFLYNVQNLGFNIDAEFTNVAELYRLLTTKYAQQKIKGSVNIGYGKQTHTAQQTYQQFVLFCQEKPITLVYYPEGATKPYFRDGLITEVTYDEQDTLTTNIEFTCTSLFYHKLRQVVIPDSQEYAGKIYNYEYDYMYKGQLANTITFEVDTNIPSPVIIEMSGELVNPTWNHYVDGKQVATGRLLATIPEGAIVKIDTTKIPYSIKEYSNGGTYLGDLYNYSDFATQRFIELQKGTNTITISDDTANKVILSIEARLYYASV